MKKLILSLGVAAALVSCSAPDLESTDRLKIDNVSDIKVVKFEEHEYLAYDVNHGGSLCHSESCPCKSEWKSLKKLP
jgi:hypothetical protein